MGLPSLRAWAAGQYVKTLDVWMGRGHCRSNPVYMSTFRERTGSNGVDAVRAGTLRAHQAHMATWDLTDSRGAEVPDGEHTIWMMIAEGQRSNQPTAQVTFTKGPEPTMATAADSANFVNVVVSYEQAAWPTGRRVALGEGD